MSLFRVGLGFVQVPSLIMEAHARSLWCGSLSYVGIVSKHQLCHGMDIFPYVLHFLAKRLSVPGLEERCRLSSLEISCGALDRICQSEERRLKTAKFHVGNVAYVFPLMRQLLSVKSCVTSG